jgi:hypothetical protein
MLQRDDSRDWSSDKMRDTSGSALVWNGSQQCDACVAWPKGPPLGQFGERERELCCLSPSVCDSHGGRAGAGAGQTKSPPSACCGNDQFESIAIHSQGMVQYFRAAGRGQSSPKIHEVVNVVANKINDMTL